MLHLESICDIGSGYPSFTTWNPVSQSPILTAEECAQAVAQVRLSSLVRGKVNMIISSNSETCGTVMNLYWDLYWRSKKHEACAIWKPPNKMIMNSRLIFWDRFIVVICPSHFRNFQMPRQWRTTDGAHLNMLIGVNLSLEQIHQ